MCPCVSVCAGVCINRGEHCCEYKTFTMKRASAGCVQPRGEGVLCVCVCLSACRTAYTLTRVSVSAASAAPCYLEKL